MKVPCLLPFHLKCNFSKNKIKKKIISFEEPNDGLAGDGIMGSPSWRWMCRGALGSALISHF